MGTLLQDAIYGESDTLTSLSVKICNVTPTTLMTAKVSYA